MPGEKHCDPTTSAIEVTRRLLSPAHAANPSRCVGAALVTTPATVTPASLVSSPCTHHTTGGVVASYSRTAF